MHLIEQIFAVSKPIIGMLHLPALPGTPKAKLSMSDIIAHVCHEAEVLAAAGVHGIMIENMHDRPYTRPPIGIEIISSMSVIGQAVRNTVDLPMGIQVLAAGNQEALAIAHTIGAQFIRAEGFVFGHIADEGYIDGSAAELMRYRKQLGADHIKVFADIKKKHSSHQITKDVSIAETASAAEFFLADGVIVTGSSTAQPADISELEQVTHCIDIPVLIGSGVNAENLATYFSSADAIIVGSAFKQKGLWHEALCQKSIEDFMQTYNQLQSQNL